MPVLRKESGTWREESDDEGNPCLLRAPKVPAVGAQQARLVPVAIEPHTCLTKTLRLKRETDRNWKTCGSRVVADLW